MDPETMQKVLEAMRAVLIPGSTSIPADMVISKELLERLARAAVGVFPQGWQPIETAPKGDVLLYYPPTQNGHPSNALPAWIVVGCAGGTSRKATHWQPLPAAPAQGNGT